MVYVCVCAYIHACMYICMYVCTYVYMCVCMIYGYLWNICVLFNEHLSLHYRNCDESQQEDKVEVEEAIDDVITEWLHTCDDRETER